jgi:hypothetical protein
VIDVHARAKTLNKYKISEKKKSRQNRREKKKKEKSKKESRKKWSKTGDDQQMEPLRKVTATFQPVRCASSSHQSRL